MFSDTPSKLFDKRMQSRLRENEVELKRYILVIKLRNLGFSLKNISKELKTNTSKISRIIKNGKPIQKSLEEIKQEISNEIKKEKLLIEYNNFIKPRKELRKSLVKKRNSKLENYSIWSRLGGRERTRELVRARDGYTCQTCKREWKVGQRRFDVHHLNGVCGKKSRSYDKVSEMDGLITLCHKCHFNHPEHSRKLKKLAIKLSY